MPDTPSSPAAATPMMEQYLAAKQAHPDCLLFFRMGDFYELFFEDAEIAAAALDIALTRRGQHKGQDVPMAGVPAHAHEAYLARLIRQGFKVAICEQIETPAEARKRSGRTLVRREVTRIVTRGTVSEDWALDTRRNNWLVAIAEAGGSLGLAAVDITTGALRAEPCDKPAGPLAQIDPGEILIANRLTERQELFETLAEWKDRLTVQSDSRFDSENARARLCRLYGVATLDAYGAFSRAEIAAMGALLDYVELTQGALPRLDPPRQVSSAGSMLIDATTRRNLELVQTLSGERRGSLLATIDRTLTGPGARKLANHLAAPLIDPATICARLDAVQALAASDHCRSDLRDSLRRCPDLERALGRIGLGRGGPRDLAAIRDALSEAEALRERLKSDELLRSATLIRQAIDSLAGDAGLADRLRRALVDEPPTNARDGGFIRQGYLVALDEQRTLRDDSRKLIATLQARYVSETGIQGLKIRHNNVLGYYVEVTATHADKLKQHPHDSVFRQRQSLASATRFTTVELAELEGRIAQAAEKVLALEQRLFDDLVHEVQARSDAVAAVAAAIATLDVAQSHAELSTVEGWTRPEIVEDTRFLIDGGRHPVVAAALAREAKAFIGNACDLSDDQRLWLLTGPNMAGKSTFLRQNALIAILAQIGAYVPAERAVIGVVDRLFSRVGAADDLARGRSTFMVEMIETAAILNQATPRSLVILDEIGRGTATFDGLSIAWACVEHLHEITRCRALFATHYHELTALASKLPRLAPYSMRVQEWRGEIVFLHEVAPGAADGSYGIHVARLAGLPDTVIARAEAILATLEAGETSGRLANLAEDLPLFAAATPPPVAQPSSEIEEQLRQVNPDEMTPRDALELLYSLRRMI